MYEYVIVGAGVFGLSTALSLIRDCDVIAHTIVICDVYEPPSDWSAANDFNKIIRCEYNKKMYTRLAIEALQMWRNDPLFSKSYVECGRVLATPMSHEGRIQYEREGIANLQTFNEGMKYQYWTGGNELAELFAAFKNNRIPQDKEVKWNPESGIGLSAQTLEDVYQYLKKAGVHFRFGEQGNVVSVKEGEVITADGESVRGSNVLISSGANTGKLINLHNQQSATGLFVTHIQLTQEEYEKYKDIPVIFDGDMGYFFQPDKKSRKMKICLNGGGIKRTVKSDFPNESPVSLPRFQSECATDTIPRERVGEVHDMLRQYIPELADHPLIDHKICWIADTVGMHFLIDESLDLPKVFVATGDSGHGYKFFPNIGRYIAQRMLGTLEDAEMAECWSWKDRRDEPMVDPAQNKWRVTKGTRDISEIDFY